MNKRNAEIGMMFGSAGEAADGPSPRASLISLSVHVAAALAAIVFLQFGPAPVPHKPVRITMLEESRLVAPPQQKLQVPLAAGGAGGDHQQLAASKGEMPKPTAIHGPIALRALKVKPQLQVSPTIIEAEPPKFENAMQYGNPIAVASAISPGPGFGGLGGGNAPGLNGAPGDRLGRGHGSFLGRVVYRMGELTKVPVLVYKVAPGYSDEARAARCHGTVLLGVIIDETGRPRDIHVLKPLGLGLDEKAVEAVGRWRFSPGLKDGQPVCVAAHVEVNFQLL